MARVSRFAAIGALLLGCGTAPVRPLGAGGSAVDFSIGGPVVGTDVAAPVPVPLLGYRRGLDDRSDAFGRLHLVPAAVRILGIEAGATRLLLEQRGAAPAVGASAEVLVVAGADAALGIPAASLQASWATGAWVLYLGSQQAASFGRRLQGSGAALHWAPFGGATLDVGRWTLGAELRWWDPHVGRDVLVWWQGVGGRGALAPLLSVTRRLGEPR